ncbi:MAG: hypothetical protein Q8K60_09170 [Parachlamydiaceae bacterium]|nr:hypothetical protein [Parachlamydiaceae bacterium]
MKSFYRVKKSFVTLIETLIAMALLAVLLTIIFGFFRELSIMSQTTEQKQKESFQMRYLESRLSSIFERIVNENAKARTFFFYTQPSNSFSTSTSLIFTFDNGIRKDPLFSGDILARLYLDKNSKKQSEFRDSSYNLVLAMWPLHVEKPEDYLVKEVLLEGVRELDFEFYAAPDRITNSKALASKTTLNTDDNVAKVNEEGTEVLDKKEADTVPEKDKWHENEWLITHNQMPVILKMKLEVEKPLNLLEKNKEQSREQTQEITFTFVLPSSKNPVHYPADAVP